MILNLPVQNKEYDSEMDAKIAKRPFERIGGKA